MITLKIENKELDLMDASVSLVMKNPIFLSEPEGGYSYPFKVAMTENNKEILDYLYRDDSMKSNFLPRSGEILVNGNSFASGQVFLKKASSLGFEVSLATGNGEFFALVKDKKLSSLVFDLITFDTAEDALAEFESICNGETEAPYFIFPVLNELFYDTTNAWSDSYFNPWRDGFVYQENINNEDPPPSTKEIFVLFLKLHFVLNEIFKQHGYNVIDRVFNLIPELEKLCLFNIYDIDSAYNPFYSSLLSINLSKSVPDVLISDFLKELSKLLPIEFIYDHSKRQVTYILKTQIIVENNYKTFVHPPSSVIEAEFDAPVSGFELKQGRDTEDQLSLPEHDIDLDRLKNIVDTYDDLPEPSSDHAGFIYLVLMDNTYYQCMFTGMSYHWVIVDFALTTKQEDKGFKMQTAFSLYPDMEKTIQYQVEKLKYDPVLHETRIAEYTQVIVQKVPCFEIAHSYYPGKGLKLMFYRGMIKQRVFQTDIDPLIEPEDIDPVIEYYPQGSRDVYNVNGVKIEDANIALIWDGPYGLYETFWKKWIWWNQNRRKDVIISQMLTEAELSDIDFTSKYRINDVDYLIKEINVSISNNGIKPATLKLARC
ncbi:MAG: hypothetical protein AB9842_08115 [Bacteroidales bacterium]